ncbi:MAG TPA: hypothetical protein VEB23_07120 [Ramlibacter sp.]|nr:hypothetical protein [Ramlibacter sp.]
MSWSGGYQEWVDGETAYLSVVFTWFLDKAYAQALWHRALGRKVRVGGPAMFTMKHELADLRDVEVGGDVPDAIARHNPLATVASRGCPEGCGFCIVTPMEGKEFTLLPNFPVRPILCDNNLSALPPEYQDYIIERYRGHGVQLKDANSGFEPKTFTEEVYRRWKPLVNEGGGPWRFAYDNMEERDRALRVMRMLRDEPAKRKRVYVLIGNEPFAECMQRITETVAEGCEPHVQPEIKLSSHERRPWVKHSRGWEQEAERRGIVIGPRDQSLTPGEKLLGQVARWANSWSYRKCTFDEWDPKRNNSRTRPVYDTDQGLYTEVPA